MLFSLISRFKLKIEKFALLVELFTSLEHDFLSTLELIFMRFYSKNNYFVISGFKQ